MEALARAHPTAPATHLKGWKDPFQMLVLAVLSAQCTDDAVNAAAPALFARYPGPAEMAELV